VTSAEILALVDASWSTFRDGVERARGAGFDGTTEAGWTVRGMLAHICAWHDASAYRLHRFAATGQPQPKVEPDDDTFNARVASESADRSDDEILDALHGSFRRLRDAIATLPPGSLQVDGGWAEAVIAGNTYEHYEEHLAELEVANAGRPA
jgi:hypothetical protein